MQNEFKSIFDTMCKRTGIISSSLILFHIYSVWNGTNCIFWNACITHSKPHLRPLICLISLSSPCCILEDTDMLVKVHMTVLSAHCVDSEKTPRWHVLSEPDVKEKQSTKWPIRETEEQTDRLNLWPAVCKFSFLLKFVSFQVGGKGWEGGWPLPGDRSGTCEGGPKVLPSHWSGESDFSLYLCVYFLNYLLQYSLEVNGASVSYPLHYH